MNLDPDPDSTEPMKPTFISWKGWKSTFGRWYIWGPLFIHVACIVGYVVGDHWLAYAFCTAVLLTLWIYGYINWRALLKIDHKHPNNHRVDICEGCDPVCYADDGRPLSYWDWLSTVHRIEVPAYYQLDSERTYELASAYQAYKAHPKFKNYKP